MLPLVGVCWIFSTYLMTDVSISMCYTFKDFLFLWKLDYHLAKEFADGKSNNEFNDTLSARIHNEGTNANATVDIRYRQ